MPYVHNITVEPYPVGAVLTSGDLEPCGGTEVRDCGGTVWRRANLYESGGNWQMEPDGGDYETWTKVAGNYGPVTVVRAPDEDELDYARRWLT